VTISRQPHISFNIVPDIGSRRAFKIRINQRHVVVGRMRIVDTLTLAIVAALLGGWLSTIPRQQSHLATARNLLSASWAG
jgi:hypothetical protein